MRQYSGFTADVAGFAAEADAAGADALAVGAVVRHQRDVLVLVRAAHNPFMPNKGDLPGGYVLPQESILDALRRELKEETGLAIEGITRYLGAFSYRNTRGLGVMQANFEVSVATYKVVLNPNEHSAFRWVEAVDLSSMRALQCSPEALNVFRTAALSAEVPGRVIAREDTEALIAEGEGGSVEFKQTARSNLGTRDERLEHAVLKTIAGFLNGEGGTLLIGVADDGQVVGLDEDYHTLKRRDGDGFITWLMNYVDHGVGKPALSYVRARVLQVDGVDVCRVDVSPAPRAVFVRPKSGGTELYVRFNNGTRLLDTAEAIEYVASHF